MIFDLLIIPSLFHSDGEVRHVAITVSLKLYEIAGEVIRTKINDVGNFKPSLLRQINDEFAKLEKKGGGKSPKKTGKRWFLFRKNVSNWKFVRKIFIANYTQFCPRELSSYFSLEVTPFSSFSAIISFVSLLTFSCAFSRFSVDFRLFWQFFPRIWVQIS